MCYESINETNFRIAVGDQEVDFVGSDTACRDDDGDNEGEPEEDDATVQPPLVKNPPRNPMQSIKIRDNQRNPVQPIQIRFNST